MIQPITYLYVHIFYMNKLYREKHEVIVSLAWPNEMIT